MHTCPNGKKYVGITNDTKRRWGSFGLDYEHCTRFYSAIRKYGWINIQHKILKNGLSQEEAWKEEKKYIEQYNLTNPRKGYNISLGGEGVNVKYRKVIQYDHDGNILHIFDSQCDASRKLNIHQTTISKICIHKQRSTKEGYVFRYENDPFDIDNHDIDPLCIPIYQLDFDKNIIGEYSSISDAARNVGCHWSSIKSALDKENRKCCEFYWCTKENYKKYNPTIIDKHRRIYRKVIQLDMDNNYIRTYKSLREAGDAIGVRHSSIKEVCVGEREQTGGYKWKFEDELTRHTSAKRVYQIDMSTGKTIKIFDTISDANKLFGVSNSHISDVCNGKRESCYGYMWKYADEVENNSTVEAV